MNGSTRRTCKVCLRHQERNTEGKSKPECATTLEQVRVTTGRKQIHSVEPTMVTRWVSLVVQKPLTLPEHPSTPQVLFRFVLLDL
jgi:hypothetical protein